MTLRFPDWWKGGYPDREQVVMDALQFVLDRVDVLDADGNPVMDLDTDSAGNPIPGTEHPRHPQAVTWLPPDYLSRLPLVRVFRGGGALAVGALADPASVQVATIADTREESRELSEFCRQWLMSYERGGTVYRADGSKTLIDTVAELIGPQLMPERSPDKRLVPLTFRVVCRKPRGIPDYAVVRTSLS